MQEWEKHFAFFVQMGSQKKDETDKPQILFGGIAHNWREWNRMRHKYTHTRWSIIYSVDIFRRPSLCLALVKSIEIYNQSYKISALFKRGKIEWNGTCTCRLRFFTFEKGRGLELWRNMFLKSLLRIVMNFDVRIIGNSDLWHFAFSFLFQVW